MTGPTDRKTRLNQTTPCLYLKCICICVCAVEWPDRQTCSQDKTDQIHPHLRSLWTCICICDKSFFCICICICICAACSGMTGQTRQTKSSPTLDLSAFPGISIIARLPTQKTSIFRVFNINASTVCQNPIAFCLPEVISNRALELENRIEDKLEPKLNMFGMILYCLEISLWCSYTSVTEVSNTW